MPNKTKQRNSTRRQIVKGCDSNISSELGSNKAHLFEITVDMCPIFVDIDANTEQNKYLKRVQELTNDNEEQFNEVNHDELLNTHQYTMASLDPNFKIQEDLLNFDEDEEESVLLFACNGKKGKKYEKLKSARAHLIKTSTESTNSISIFVFNE